MNKLLSTATILLSVGITARASSGGYSFTSIANSSSLDFLSSTPVVNDSGTVVFTATAPGGGVIGMYMGNGGALSHIEQNLTGFIRDVGLPSINNAGTVAFAASLSSGGTGIVERTPGGATNLVTNTTSAISQMYESSINSQGVIAYAGALTAGGAGVYTTDGSTVTPIATTGSMFSAFSARPAINSNGTVAFEASLTGGGSGIFSSSGGVITTISENNVPSDDPHINDAGLVSFRGPGVQVGSGGAVTNVASTSGSYSKFFDFNAYPGADFESPGITGDDTVVFAAVLKNGGTGIFTGLDPTGSAVIQTGDPLFGSTLVNVGFWGGVSDNGNIAFRYTLANGLSGEAVALPIPEPLCLSLFGFTIPLLRRRFR